MKAGVVRLFKEGVPTEQSMTACACLYSSTADEFMQPYGKSGGMSMMLINDNGDHLVPVLHEARLVGIYRDVMRLTGVELSESGKYTQQIWVVHFNPETLGVGELPFIS